MRAFYAHTLTEKFLSTAPTGVAKPVCSSIDFVFLLLARHSQSKLCLCSCLISSSSFSLGKAHASMALLSLMRRFVRRSWWLMPRIITWNIPVLACLGIPALLSRASRSMLAASPLRCPRSASPRQGLARLRARCRPATNASPGVDCHHEIVKCQKRGSPSHLRGISVTSPSHHRHIRLGSDQESLCNLLILVVRFLSYN